MKWIVVQTKSNCEKKAFFNLKRQGYEVFFPKIKKMTSRFNRFVRLVKPLFPGYIFVSINANQNWSKIKSTYGVFRILKFSDYLYFVPPDVVDSIKMRCDDKGFTIDCNNFVKGDEVKLYKSNKIGLDAVFDEQIDQKRSFVFINFLNQKVKASVETKHLYTLV